MFHILPKGFQHSNFYQGYFLVSGEPKQAYKYFYFYHQVVLRAAFRDVRDFRNTVIAPLFQRLKRLG